MTYDVAIVGGGILGLAFAWESARRGKSVIVLERDRQAQSASIRNFGMVWPIGQTAGAVYQLALKSRARWKELADQNVIWARECGSIHAVYEADENAVIEEFASRRDEHGIACEYIPGPAAAQRFPSLNHSGLRGVLWSPTEMAVDPRQAIANITRFLIEQHRVTMMPSTTVLEAVSGQLRTSRNETIHAQHIFIASGIDFQTLYPGIYSSLGLTVCKLQMLRTGPQPGGWQLGPHLAGGLTLAHYKSFEICASLPAVKARIAATMPDYVKYGIHVMASQNHLGEVIIGDSHEYDADISIFDKDEIDQLILNYLGRMLQLPNPAITARWHGLYAKNPKGHMLIREPMPGVTLLAAPGGTGMTLSFGFAQAWYEGTLP